MFEKFISLFYLLYIRPLYKWFLYKFTRLHELQRICYGAPYGSARTKGVEKSLELSRSDHIKSLITRLDELILYPIDDEQMSMEIVRPFVNTVLQVKRINPNIHPDFPQLIATPIEQIWSYKRLYNVVEELRTTPYNCDDLRHEEKLLELWMLLMPNVKLESRISKQWQDIGFQVIKKINQLFQFSLKTIQNSLTFSGRRSKNGFPWNGNFRS